LIGSGDGVFKQEDIIGTDVLDHLGLVAATIDKLDLVKNIDKHLPMTKGAKTTHGQRAMAMILNGLGFMDDRLYLFPKFLENKPVARLFGQDLNANDFNDDALGRFLDAVHAYGENKLFSEIAFPIALKYKLLSKSAHFDTTTLTVYGDYLEETEVTITEEKEVVASTDRLSLSDKAQPAYGHAKNKRCDLKQMTLLLATTGKSGFPVWMESHSGNASDKKTLEEAASRMQKFCKALKDAPATLLYVGDSALYANAVKQGKDLLWLSRVPENMKISKALLHQTDIAWTNLEDGYKMHVVEQAYGDVNQRWALMYSEQAYAREILTLEKNIQKEKKEVEKKLWHMGCQSFGCEKDIDKLLKPLRKKLKYHQIQFHIENLLKNKTKGRPKKTADDTLPEKIITGYALKAVLIQDEQAIEKAKLTKGRFILATNQLDKKALPDEQILSTYKEQSGTESGFKFIKDNAFEVDSIFLKKPGRISALMMIMTLCLMVYGFAQYFLREQLKKQADTLPSQSGKLTNKPSMKWIYRLFHGVHVLKIQNSGLMHTLILNVNDLLKKVIRAFGEIACRIYNIEQEAIATSS
jgi:transposase